jgi:hypothetical protein
MRSIIFSCFSVLGSIMASGAAAEVVAIAYCEHNRPGIGRGETAEEAGEQALINCNRECCQVIIKSNDKYPCVAFAYSSVNYAYGRAKNRLYAKSSALMDCYQDGAHPDCEVVEAGCARN